MDVRAAAQNLVDDADLMDGDFYGYLVSVSAMDKLRAALEATPAAADDPVTARLAGLVARAEEAGIRIPATTRAAVDGVTAVSMDGTTNFGGVGRAPTGRLRNFRAMNDTKLLGVIDSISSERPFDVEANEAARAVAAERGLL